MAPDEKKQPLPVSNGEQKHTFKQNPGVPSDMLCGLGPFKPAFLQCCVRMGTFTGVYSVSGLMTSVLSMYIVSQITTIEKQFGLSSAQSGLLLSCNDIGFLLTTMFFSYVARKTHIPRVLWFTSMLYGTAGLLCSIPYFLSRDYVLRQTEELLRGSSSPFTDVNRTMTISMSRSNTPMCHLNQNGYPYQLANVSKCDAKDTDEYGIGKPNQYTQTTIAIIAIGMIIQGIGKAPRYPFLTTYVDDNCKKKNTAMYMGIISGTGIFGPAIAFSLGGLFSRQHVTLQDVPLSPRHPAWVGAWWMGFIIFGVISMVVSLPLLLFPKRMRPRPVPKQTGGHGSEGLWKTIFGFFKSLSRLIRNPVYMPMLMATCVLLFAVAGMLAFMAKYLETQFIIPAWRANILIGVMSVVSASAGTIVGGIIVTKRKLSPLSCIKMIIILTSLTVAMTGIGYVLGCPNENIAGYNAQNYINGTNSSCSAACGCDSVTYFPVCGSNDVNYMSPCHAGCSSQKGMLFSECSCVGENSTATVELCETSCTMLYPYYNKWQGRRLFSDCTCVGENGTATAGLCETSCTMLYPYLIFNVVGSFTATLAMIPGFIVTIRSVTEADKPMAVGFSALLSTLCGWFAGPVAFGKIVDTTCLLWSSSCSGGGACALYDNVSLRYRKHTFELIPRVLALLFYIFVYFQARKKTDWTTDQPSVTEEGDVKQSMINGDDTDIATTPADWNKSPIYKGDKTFGGNKTFGV